MEVSTLAGNGFNRNEVVTSDGHLTKRVTKILKRMKSDGYNVLELTDNAILKLQGQLLQFNVFYDDESFEIKNTDPSKKGTKANVTYMINGLKAIRGVLEVEKL